MARMPVDPEKLAQVKALLAQKVKPADIARSVGVPVVTVREWIAAVREAQAEAKPKRVRKMASPIVPAPISAPSPPAPPPPMVMPTEAVAETQRAFGMEGLLDPGFRQPFFREGRVLTPAQYQREMESQRAWYGTMPPSSRSPSTARSVVEKEPARQAIEERLVENLVRAGKPSSRRAPTPIEQMTLRQRAAELEEEYYPGSQIPVMGPLPPRKGAKRSPPKRQKMGVHATVKRGCSKQAALDALKQTGGNKRAAARLLGMSREGLYWVLNRDEATGNQVSREQRRARRAAGV